MGNVKKYPGNPLKLVKINPNPKSHIHIKDQKICFEKCENKPCTYYCPTRVYWWEDNRIKIDHSRCIECNACPYGCPYDNIDWNWPDGGYGVDYTDYNPKIAGGETNAK